LGRRAAHQFESGLPGEEAVLVGFGVAADEIPDAGRRVPPHTPGTQRPRTGRGSRGGDHTAEIRFAGEEGDEAVQHAVRGLAYGKDAEVWESPEIIFAAGAAEGVTGDGEAAFDGQVRVHGIEGTVENSSGQLLGVVWRIFWHWRKYRRERADDEAQALTSLFCVLPQKKVGRSPTLAAKSALR
jgi:hypothetical protein